jgi:hypothetical protein
VAKVTQSEMFNFPNLLLCFALNLNHRLWIETKRVRALARFSLLAGESFFFWLSVTKQAHTQSLIIVVVDHVYICFL